jgi:hypothetical protein
MTRRLGAELPRAIDRAGTAGGVSAVCWRGPRRGVRAVALFLSAIGFPVLALG